jgi:uncharacterized protein (DUF1778 family)
MSLTGELTPISPRLALLEAEVTGISCDRRVANCARRRAFGLNCVPTRHTMELMIVVVDERKAERLVARVSATHKRLLEKAAAMEGRSVASFVVAYAVENAEKVVRQEQVIRLSLEQSQRFAEALLKPASHSLPQAVRRAKRSHKTRVIEA